MVRIGKKSLKLITNCWWKTQTQIFLKLSIVKQEKAAVITCMIIKVMVQYINGILNFFGKQRKILPVSMIYSLMILANLGFFYS